MKPTIRAIVYFLACSLVLCASLISAPAQQQGEKSGERSGEKAAEKQAQKPQDEKNKEKEEETHGLRYRQVGPFRGGRSLTATGVPGDPNVYYFGGTGGGVWKSTDGANSWKPVFDKEGSSAIGSLAVAYFDPNIVYVGTGEGCIRGNAAQGDGVYKSVDAGKTWTNIGLRDTRAIGKLIVDPRNPNIVFVAALGHPFGPNLERGIFRTTDGGKTWEKVLYKDENTGGIDVAFDPGNPHIIFAALWQVRRMPWGLNSGGPGSGLYRSTDGGTTWKRLSGNGLPDGPYGRIGVVVGANSDRVYSLIEAKEGGLYRSDDGGDKWELVNPDHRLTQRAWYYMHLTPDPKDPNGLWIMNVDFFHSTDGGHTFNKVKVPHGDNHGLWIDPTNSKRMIATNDGGATVSVDGGKSWTTQNNQPTAQFYHVITDNRFPYYIYGAQQDNTTVGIASRDDFGPIGRQDWYPVGGGESGYIAPYPPDPNIVYAGEYQGQLTRFDKRTAEIKEISIVPQLTDANGAAKLEHRFQWTAPLIISPHDANVVYHAGERVFKTSDGGMHWEAISPDLTRNDKSKQIASGGIEIDDSGTEYYDTVFALAESPLQKGLMWAGTDDGLVQITSDGGKSWKNVTPKDTPEWSRVSLIEASPHEAGKAYVAVDRHQNDDLRPYIYKTSDFGKTWSKITVGIPDNVFVRAVREDPKKKGLLFAGTENGVFVSYDDGARWSSLRLNLPNTPVHDLVIHGDDLVLATHGRSFWLLDDIGPLRQYSDTVANEDVHLYAPTNAVRWRAPHGWAVKGVTAGENPPPGAAIYFNLKAVPKQTTLEILDASGGLVKKVTQSDLEQPDEPLDPEDEKPKKQLDLKPGMNRYVWDLRYQDVPRLPNYYLYEYQDGTRGAMALPGKYQVRLTADGKSYTAPLELTMDPRARVSMADLQKQFTLVRQIQAQLARVYDTVKQEWDLRAQTHDLQTRLANSDGGAKLVLAASKQLDSKMAGVEDALVQMKISANEDSLRYPPALDARLAYLANSVGGDNDSAPTAAAYAEWESLKKQSEEQLGAWSNILSTDLANFEKVMEQQNMKALFVQRSGESASGGGK
ncbi:MAG TPA: hypothetical protein VFA76_12120 [Terriglobales bacterium]|nr:hypothetical protein [Terriglobales bacterium]